MFIHCTIWIGAKYLFSCYTLIVIKSQICLNGNLPRPQISDQPVNCVDWSPDKLGLLATASFDQKLRVIFVTKLNLIWKPVIWWFVTHPFSGLLFPTFMKSMSAIFLDNPSLHQNPLWAGFGICQKYKLIPPIYVCTSNAQTCKKTNLPRSPKTFVF